MECFWRWSDSSRSRDRRAWRNRERPVRTWPRQLWDAPVEHQNLCKRRERCLKRFFKNLSNTKKQKMHLVNMKGTWNRGESRAHNRVQFGAGKFIDIGFYQQRWFRLEDWRKYLLTKRCCHKKNIPIHIAYSSGLPSRETCWRRNSNFRKQ